jgi:predicted transcriptional regulator
VRVQIDEDDVWVMLSTVMKRILDEVDLSDDDRASLKRWRSEEMRPGRDAMKALNEKLNIDLERVMKGKERSAIQKHDWV